MAVDAKNNSIAQQTYFSDYGLISNKNCIEQCCATNKPIYEITYSLGTKWLVCYECLELECFKDGITEKVRIQT